MIVIRKKFSTWAEPKLVEGVRRIARIEGRPVQAVVEDAMRQYIESHAGGKLRPEGMDHFRASVERNRRLGELLAQ